MIRKTIVKSLVFGSILTIGLSVAATSLKYRDKPYLPTIWSRLLHPGYAVASTLVGSGNVTTSYLLLGGVINVLFYALAFYVVLAACHAFGRRSHVSASGTK